MVLCRIWYHLYNLKNVKNTHGDVLVFVNLQACKLVKHTQTIYWQQPTNCFSVFGHFIQCRWYNKRILRKSYSVPRDFSLTENYKLILWAINFIKGNTPPWMLFTFFKLYRCYQIAQSVSFLQKSSIKPYSLPVLLK